MDVVAYASQIAAQLGAHIIKVKLPTAHVEQTAAKKVYESAQIPIKSLAERVRHIVQSSFDGRRIVIFLEARRSKISMHLRRHGRFGREAASVAS